MERKNIAVIGAGFGGLRTAVLIGRKLKKLKLETQYRVVLIDQNEYHTYSPALYEVATNPPDFASYQNLREITTFPIAELTTGLPVEFINATVTDIDLRKGIITTEETDDIRYAYLVLAPGSEPNYCDIPGLSQAAIPLKTFRDAITIREYIESALEQESKTFRIVIGGAGSTGVELAGEVQLWLNRIRSAAGGSRRAEILLIDTAPTVLAPFPAQVIKKASKRLARIGIRTLLNERIVSVRDHQITLSTGGKVPFDILIWTGGVIQNKLMAGLELAKDMHGRTIASSTMECFPHEAGVPFAGKVFGVGDAIRFENTKTGNAIPLVARAALSQATVVSHNIIEDIKLHEGLAGQPQFKTFEPHQYPYVIPIGGKYAISRIGSLVISGFWGWILKLLVELNYLMSIMHKKRALRLWFKGIRIFIQNDHLG